MKRKLFLLTMLPFILIINACTTVPDSPLEIISGQDTVEINTEFVDQGALYIGETGNIVIYSEDSIDVTALGTYELRYEYSDLEITYSAKRYVIVVDQTAPMITLNLGVDTIKVGETWTDQGASAIDNSLESITVVASGSVNTNVVGTYEIVYTAMDSSGNTITMIRFVTVIE